MKSFFEKIREFKGLIPLFYESFMEIAKAPEPIKKVEIKPPENVLESMVAIPENTFNREISRTILKFMVHIKLLALDYLEEFIKGRLLVRKKNERI